METNTFESSKKSFLNNSNTNKNNYLNNKMITNPSSFFGTKNIVIIILVSLLFLSILGINILQMFGNAIESLTQIVGPLVIYILSFFGYTTGTIINKTADVVSDTTKTGVDIAEGVVQDVGNILINASGNNIDDKYKNSLNSAVNLSKPSTNPPATPEPTPSENPIQKPISSNKTNWCLVGEYMGRRGCIEINENDKCISGQVFPTNSHCLNPNLSMATTPTTAPITTPTTAPTRQT